MTRRDVPAWLPMGLLLLVLLSLFHRLLSGQTLFWGLPALQFYPWRSYAFEQLARGQLPAWNPYLGAGAPLLANYQTALFYPPNWLALVMSDAQAMGLVAALHVVWAGMGMWLFTGALDVSRFGRGISMLAYAFSGYLIARFGSFPTADAAAWVPWIFWLVHLLLTEQRLRDVGWLALAFGMQLLAGHAQTTWYGGVAVGLYALWIVLRLQRRERAARRLRGLALAGAGMALGLGLAMIQLLPTFEYFQQSARAEGLSYDLATNLSYPPLQLLTLLSPRFFGTPADGSYLAGGVFFENAAYIGVIPLIAAGAAVVGWMQKRRFLLHYPAFRTVPFWIMLGGAGFLVAMGRFGPFFRPLYEHVPTFDFFREPVRWMILPEFSLAVLAGIGTGHWARGRWTVFWSRLLAAGSVGIALLGLAARQFVATSDALDVLTLALIALGSWLVCAALLTLTQPLSASFFSPRLWQVTVLAVVAIDLGWAASGLNPTVTGDFYRNFGVTRPEGRIYWFEAYEDEVKFERFFDPGDYILARDQWPDVRGSLLPNLNMLDRVPALNNFDPLVPQHYRAYLDLIEAAGPDAGPLLRAAGVSQVYGETQPEGWQGEAPLFVLPEAPPRAWLVPEADWYADDAAIAAALTDPAWEPSARVILAGEALASSADADAAGADALQHAEITVLENAPDRVRYRIRTDAPIYLVVATTWYPGWTATLDGAPLTLYRANLAFQAVRVPAGGGDVTLDYAIDGWRSGAAVSAGAFLITLAVLALGSLTLARRRARLAALPPDID